jgi:hypothetical protein
MSIQIDTTPASASVSKESGAMGLDKSIIHLWLRKALIIIRSFLLCMNWPESHADHSCAAKLSRSEAGLDISMQGTSMQDTVQVTSVQDTSTQDTSMQDTSIQDTSRSPLQTPTPSGPRREVNGDQKRFNLQLSGGR